MMNKDDAIEAFACCTQIPPDCTNCPEKGPTGELGRGCKSDVKTSVYHWLVVQEPVVRCKDCKHRPIDNRNMNQEMTGFSIEFPDNYCPCQCEDGWYNWYPPDDWYCAGGERRDGET